MTKKSQSDNKLKESIQKLSEIFEEAFPNFKIMFAGLGPNEQRFLLCSEDAAEELADFIVESVMEVEEYNDKDESELH